MAERTGLEPATPCVTGRYSNQLNYRSTDSFTLISNRLITVCSRYFPCHRKRNKFDAWQFPTLAWGGPTLPSALRRFTSEFGMGSGGTTALKPPGKFCLRAAAQGRADCPVQAENRVSQKRLWRCKVKPHGSLVPVSSTHRCAYTPGLSTSSSLTFLQET